MTFYTGLENPYAALRVEGLSIEELPHQAQERLKKAFQKAAAQAAAVPERFVEVQLKEDGSDKEWYTKVVTEVHAAEAAEHGLLSGVAASAEPEEAVRIVEERLAKEKRRARSLFGPSQL